MSITQDANIDLDAVAPSQAIVERIAKLEGVDHTELVPLFEAVDPDAIDDLISTTGPTGTPLQIEFTYHGYAVTVTGDGVVHIDEDATFEG